MTEEEIVPRQRLAEAATLAAHLADTVPALTAIAAELVRLSDLIAVGAERSDGANASAHESRP